MMRAFLFLFLTSNAMALDVTIVVEKRQTECVLHANSVHGLHTYHFQDCQKIVDFANGSDKDDNELDIATRGAAKTALTKQPDPGKLTKTTTYTVTKSEVTAVEKL